MKESLKQTKKTPVTIGLLAHVDAGKTTLAEALLYKSGKLRSCGRVDHQDAFLDTYDLEKQRGITIFSKQAQLMLRDQPVTLLDTPGHVDFSPETERTLQVLDYAILVISGADGVRGHVQTLWRLLAHHRIPVFLFINKMDQEVCEKESLLRELKENLSDSCVDFSVQDEFFYESLATGSEEALEEFLEQGTIRNSTIRSLIRTRSIFPCYFGSALKLTGIEEFLSGLRDGIQPRPYPDAFGARVFKISRDEHGERLTCLKVTGGSLKARMLLSSGISDPGNPSSSSADSPATGGKEVWKEKVNQIRIYDGSGWHMAEEVPAGTICTVTGLTKTRCGDGLGIDRSRADAELVPVLTCQVLLPESCDIHRAVSRFYQLQEEEPQLHVVWKEAVNELHVQVMGPVQMEILKNLLKERFDLDAEFGTGSIIYKETIQNTVEGVGHFEPLRHYAEVHLLLEPAARGSGMTFSSDCSEDQLDKNWQRLILTHLSEKQHTGVLTGSGLTDLKITLRAGRAHEKHTEGGDFRQATYRAVRQGLMQAESVLLEPFYAFRLEIPANLTGRAISDIQRMHGSFDPPETGEETAVLTGRAPAAAMQNYPMEVISYTRGAGRISLEFCGYDICHNPEEVIAESGYDAERDTENPASSIFCSHGSGYVVPWDSVFSHMHLASILQEEKPAWSSGRQIPSGRIADPESYGQLDSELKEIFERTYGSGTFHPGSGESVYQTRRKANPADLPEPGSSGRQRDSSPKTQTYKKAAKSPAPVRQSSGWTDGSSVYSGEKITAAGQKSSPKEEYLLVDGYNIIFAWEELNELARLRAEAARGRLMDILCNYQGYRGMTLILVFDAYRVENNPGETFRYHNIYVVYTKEAETADQYIEKTVHRIGKKYDVTVATSDGLEQVIILGGGARRMSAAQLHTEIEEMARELRQVHLTGDPGDGHHLFDDLNEETANMLEEIRLGRKAPPQ